MRSDEEKRDKLRAEYDAAVTALARLERRAAQTESDIAALRKTLDAIRALRAKLGLV